MILMTREERFELGTAYKRKPTILLSYMTLDNLLKKKKIWEELYANLTLYDDVTFKNFAQIYFIYITVGPKGPRGFGPFHPKPKAHAEEEEVPGDEWRESKLSECTAEDDSVLNRPKSWEKKAPHLPRTSTRGSQKRLQAIWASHRGIGGEAAPGKAVTSVLNTHN